MKKGMRIPFSPPDITEEEVREVADTLLSGWITTGPKTKALENQIAEYCQTEKAVCLNSATACMEMTLRLFGIGPGDEVITTAYTYTATASSIYHTGATPVIIDTAKDSYEMDYEELERRINPNTKAVMPVDLAGVICDYDRIFEIVERKKNLFRPSDNIYQKAMGRMLVLADCAHGFGAVRKGKPSGQFADVTTFSFHAVKNLTTAEGGALVWKNIPGISNDEMYRQLMLLSLHGQSKDALAKTKAGAWEYDILSPAYKCNMTDIQASLGLVQLKRYPNLLKRRREIIEKYEAGLEQINHRVEGCTLDWLRHVTGENISSGHLFLVRLLGCGREIRDSLIEKLAEKGVGTNVHYKPLPMLTAYRNLGYDIKDYPNAYHMFENEITLPLHTCLTDKQVQYVLDSFEECLLEVLKVEE